MSAPRPLETPLSDEEIHDSCLETCTSGIRRNRRGKFRCPLLSMCKEGFKTVKELHLHIHDSHLICLLCHGIPTMDGVRYADVDAYSEHFRTTHKKCVFSAHCGAGQFPDHDALLSHYAHCHPLQCCLRCRLIPLPKFGKSTIRQVLCKRCAFGVFVRAPILIEIPDGHDVFIHVEKEFRKDWHHPSPTPTVVKVWKIYGKKVYVDKYHAYKKKVIEASGCSNGNAHTRWHGSTRTCHLGDDGSWGRICNDRRCSLCRIIETKFDIAKFGTNTNWGRFGRGIYTSSTSSKADSYAMSHEDSPHRTMLLNAVVLGRSIVYRDNHPYLQQPPDGYESVTGLPGLDLNYDESVVYDPSAP